MKNKIIVLTLTAGFLWSTACSNAGSENGGETIQAGQNPPPASSDNKFVTLDGANNYLSYAGNLVGGEVAYTVEFFVSFDDIADTDAGQALYSFSDAGAFVSGVWQRVNAQGRRVLNSNMNGGGAVGEVQLSMPQWYHVAISYEATPGGFKTHTYVDGIEKANATHGGTAFRSHSDRFEIGGSIGLTKRLRGSIDGLRISRGVRYANNFTTPNRLNMESDTTTIAVWNFNETPGDGKYYDAVGQKLLQKQ